MQLFHCHSEDGFYTGFEFENIYISHRSIKRLLRSLPQVSEVEICSWFHHADDRLTFTYHGIPFSIWEPFGDNDRYAVNPCDVYAAVPDWSPLQQVFAEYQPTWWRRFLGAFPF